MNAPKPTATTRVTVQNEQLRAAADPRDVAIRGDVADVREQLAGEAHGEPALVRAPQRVASSSRSARPPRSGRRRRRAAATAMTAVMIALRRSIPKISSSSRALTRAAARRRASSSSARSTARRAASPSARRSAAGSASSSASRSCSIAASPFGNDVELGAAPAGTRRAIPAATSARPEWSATTRRHARRRGLGRDHAERLGEDRRHDGDVDERQQVHEVPVLERAGEERARRRQRLELARGSRRSRRSPRARRARAAPRTAPARPCSRSASRSRGRSARRSAKNSREPRGVAGIGMALVAVGGRRARASAISAASAASRGCGHELVDVDAGRHLVHAVDVADDVFEHAADVLRADVHGAAPARAPRRPSATAARCRASSTRARSRAP